MDAANLWRLKTKSLFLEIETGSVWKEGVRHLRSRVEKERDKGAMETKSMRLTLKTKIIWRVFSQFPNQWFQEERRPEVHSLNPVVNIQASLWIHSQHQSQFESRPSNPNPFSRKWCYRRKVSIFFVLFSPFAIILI